MKRASLLCVLIGLASCKYYEERWLEYNLIGSVIKIEQGDFFTSDDRSTRLELKCETEASYASISNDLRYEKILDGNKLTILFTKVTSCEICLMQYGPASTVIDLGDLGNGKYDIAINNGLLRNKGTLTISDTDLVLDLKRSMGIDILNSHLKRSPANTYCGAIEYRKEQNIDRINEFLEKLQSMEDVVGFNDQEPGKYTYYEIGEDRRMISNRASSGYPFAIPVIFQYNGPDHGKFAEDLRAIALPYSDVMRFALQSSSSGYMRYTD